MLCTTVNYVMVKPDVAETETESGLTIPGSAQQTVSTGTIVSTTLDQQEVIGNRCIFKPHSGIMLEVNGEKVIFLHVEDDLLALEIPDEVAT